MTKVYQKISRWSRGIVRVLGKRSSLGRDCYFVLNRFERRVSFGSARVTENDRTSIENGARGPALNKGFFLVKAKKKSSLGIGLAILTALKEAERN